MSFFDDALKLLRRPAAPQFQTQPVSGRRGVKPATQPDLPVTEAELRRALDACFPARQAAEDEIAAATASREELLLSDAPDAEDRLLDIERRVNLAVIRLERTEKLELALHARLRAISGTARKERFAALRDEVAAAAQAALPALREAAHANERWQKIQAAALLEFPDADKIMPGVIGISLADIRHFEADVETFRRAERHVKPMPYATSAADMVKAAIQSGRPLDEFPTIGAEIVVALGPDVAVTLIRSTTGPDGRKLKAGTDLMLPPMTAQELIAGGYAKLRDKK